MPGVLVITSQALGAGKGSIQNNMEAPLDEHEYAEEPRVSGAILGGWQMAQRCTVCGLKPGPGDG